MSLKGHHLIRLGTVAAKWLVKLFIFSLIPPFSSSLIIVASAIIAASEKRSAARLALADDANGSTGNGYLSRIAIATELDQYALAYLTLSG